MNVDLQGGSTMPAAAQQPHNNELTYSEAFPPLPGAAGNGTEVASTNSLSSHQWNKMSKMSVRSSTTTQAFTVPVEERRYREISEQQFGERGREQAKICADIMAKTGVKIEMSLAKDQSLNVVVTGKSDAVMKARKLIVQLLQTQSHSTIHIPKEHHRFILGPKGSKLAELELATATKINVPRPNDPSDAVVITGTRDGIERVKHEIQLISDEQSKLASEHLPIPKIYHPFICGPDNQTLNEIIEHSGAQIRVPPRSVMKDDIFVSGEKEGVVAARNAIMRIYEDRVRKCVTISVEVKKSQHRFVIGAKAAGLSEILASTGVSVEVPPLDSGSETITLRGDSDKLGAALTMVYSKANSIETRVVKAPLWLHRHIIGRQGANIRRITADLPRVHIEFNEEQEEIHLEGPPEEVEQAQKIIQDQIKELVATLAFVELNIDPKFHRHIVGKAGANVNRLKNELGVDIRIPSDADHGSIIRIEGSAEGVAKAKAELMELVDKVENEKSRDIIIEQRLHRLIIGTQGAHIREIREQFPSVLIFIPDQSRKSDVITLRGPKNDVDRCFAYLQKHVAELMSSNVVREVRVYRKYLRDIVATLRKVREETDTRIDVPSENGTDNMVALTVTGSKEGVEKAKELIEKTQTELGRITETTVDIPHAQHATLQGAKGQLLRAVRDECGGVMIRFPAATANSDKVLLRGPTEDVEKAKKLLLDLASDRGNSNLTAEIHAKPAFHRFLIGRNGAHVRDLHERTGARVIFPSSSDADSDVILIIGQQSAIDKARQELEAKIKDLENIVEEEMTIDQRHHRHFVVRKGEILRQVMEEFGGISVSFPRVGVKSDKVVLKGAAECVKAAKGRILEIVQDLENQVSIDCTIPSKHHRAILGQKGQHVQEITRNHHVNIKFPDRNNEAGKDQEEASVNGDDEASPGGDASISAEKGRQQDVIVITGKPEDCRAAKEALMALIPVTEEMEVPLEYHRLIIGQKGRDVRRLMDDFNVNIIVPQPDECCDLLRVTGLAANVARARTAIEERIKQLDEEKHQRELRSYKLEVNIDPKFHPKIIGRRGAVVTKIRQDHDVHIQFADKTSEHPDVITITGVEKNTLAAKEDILRIVQELEDLVNEEVEIDHRVHSRIIGARGRAIHKIMEEFHVDVRFPGRESENPNLVVITGTEDAVAECRDHLLNLEEEYLQDVSEREYINNSRDSNDNTVSSSSSSDGFMVRGAPWSAPDTTSMDDFPDLSAAAVAPAAAASPSRLPKWGPRR